MTKKTKTKMVKVTKQDAQRLEAIKEAVKKYGCKPRSTYMQTFDDAVNCDEPLYDGGGDESEMKFTMLHAHPYFTHWSGRKITRDNFTAHDLYSRTNWEKEREELVDAIQNILEYDF